MAVTGLPPFTSQLFLSLMESYGLLGEFTGAGDSGAGSQTRIGPHYSKLVSLSSCCCCRYPAVAKAGIFKEELAMFL
jgi:hypothetical protein